MRPISANVSCDGIGSGRLSASSEEGDLSAPWYTHPPGAGTPVAIMIPTEVEARDAEESPVSLRNPFWAVVFHKPPSEA